MILLFLKHAILLAAQGAAALGLGRLCLRRPRGLPEEDRLLFAAGAGYGVMAAASFVLGVTGNLAPLAVAGLWTAGLLSLGLSRWRLRTEPDFWSALRKPRSVALLCVATALAQLLYGHAPPLHDDSVYVYLALPQAYARARRLIEVPENPHAYFPQSIEMLYTQLFLWSSAEAPKLLHWLFGLLCAGVASRLAWRHLGSRRLALPVAAFLTMPWVTSLSGSGKIDLGSLFYGLLAFHAWLCWRSERERGLFLLAAWMAGLHFATKYAGGAVVAVLLLASLAELRRSGVRALLRAAAIFCALAALPILPWLVRNLALTGNPLYPIQLPGHPGDPYLYAFLRSSAAHSWMEYTARCFRELVFGDIIWGTGPMLWAVVPFLLLDRTCSLRSRPLVVLGAAACVMSAAVFPGVPMTRFLAPGLALLAFAAGAFAAARWDVWTRTTRLAFFALFLAPGLLLALYFGAKRLPLWAGLESSLRFTQKNWRLPEDYGVSLYVRERLPRGSTVLFSYQNVAPAFFYPDHRAVGLGLYPPSFYAGEAAPGIARLRADGVRYLVWAPRDCVWDAAGACGYPSIDVKLVWLKPQALRDRLRLLFQGARSAVYEIQG